MTEGPGLGGYPDLAKPGTRATQAYRGVWTALLVAVPRQLRTVQSVRRGLRSVGKRKA
jgi:hypothetical protein